MSKSWIDSHDNFMKAKTYFMLIKGLGRYFPGNEPILERSQSKFEQICGLSPSFTVAIQPSSTPLIKPNLNPNTLMRR